jgi:peptide/nickel transport system permease protein
VATYLARRIVWGLVVVLGVATVVFVATHLLTDPARKALPLGASQEQYEHLRHDLGLDRPLVTQFGDFAAGAVHFDFGKSISLQESAAHVVAQRLPATLKLVGVALALAILVSLPLGFLAAMKPGSWLDVTTVTTSLTGLSLPQFWLGALLILVFAVHLKWLPTSGDDGIKSLILPAITLALPIAGRLTQITRSSVIDELHRQYVVAARAKGLPLQVILRKHVFRNAAVPISSYLSLETAKALAGSTVVVETVFAYPGVGYLSVQAAKADDVVLIEATVVIIAVLIVVLNILFDLFHGVLDPRIRVAQ